MLYRCASGSIHWLGASHERETCVQNYSTKKFSSRGFSRFSSALFLAAALAVLAGCGSGGAGGSSPAAAGGTGGTGGATDTGSPVPTITFALTDAAGASVTSISTGAPATVKATLRDANGAIVSNSVVTFSTDPTLATITPSNSALTDATGVATVTLAPASITAAGASTLSATAQVDTSEVTGSIGFSIGASAVTISAPVLGVGTAALSAFGTTSISVTVSSGGAPVTTPQNVTFSSTCASSGKAVLSTGVATVAGVATGSYRDNGCAGTDAVTATVAGITSASTSLVVTPPTVGSIQFVSATPETIFLKGTGGVETSQVRFKVVDTGGNPISGKAVTFALSTAAGGITLTPAPATATSDADGLVVTNVNAGTVSTPVRVTASTPGATAGSTLTTQSSALTITTGIPAQDSFSLSATKLNPEFRDVDGNTTVLTARLADHFRNPVPDGTAVNFTTEGGSIIGTCQTSGGACSATMTSQLPRPIDGRATVLAYAVGEEGFIDGNGNGVADLVPNEMFDINGFSTDMPEAFRDDNENGVFDAATETFIDFNQNNAYNNPDGQYNGVLCDNVTAPPTGSSAGTCSATKSIHVRGSLVIVFSGSTAVISKISPAGAIDLRGCAGGGTTQVDLRIVDVVGNPMPVGTTVVATTSDGSMTGLSSFTQPNTNVTPAAGAITHTVNIKDDAVTTTSGTPPVTTCTDPTLSGVLSITVTTPGDSVAGTVTTAQFAVIR